jgi:hypothetical protein
VERAINHFSHLTSHVSPFTFAVVGLIALATRLSVAFLLPNAEQDGYSYAEEIAQLSAKFATGHFQLIDLFGFWLPFFQVAAAIPNLRIDNPLLTGKILSALCGALSCLLVFAITKKLTRSLGLACLAFALIVSSPLHLLYSAACMTDVPFACLVLASLWFVLQRRWVIAAIFAALAEGVRVEAWTLIVVLPFLQLVYERRISLLGLAILLLPPFAWLGLSQFATGDPFAFFAKRARYQASYLDFYPTRKGFASADIRQDAGYFLLGANHGVVLASITALGWSILRAARRHRGLPLALGALLGYAAALLGFILFLYLIKRQPVLFPRYGLIFFALGLPLLAWLIRLSIQSSPNGFLLPLGEGEDEGSADTNRDSDFTPSSRTTSRCLRLIAAAAILLCLWEAKREIPIISKVFADFQAHQQIAQTLATAFQESGDREQRCFSDDAAVRVLSRLPPDRFVRTETAGGVARQNIDNFESYLRQHDVSYLVFTRVENSLPVKFYPDLGRNKQTDIGKFQFIAVASSPFAPDVWLYRLRQSDKGR